jgi:hypothetical protein
MSSKMLPEVSTASSKADELKFLDIVIGQVSSGSYLGALFSPQMVSWLQSQIRNDFSCDLFADYENLSESLSHKEKGYQEIIRERGEELETLRAKLNQEKDRANRIFADYEEIRDRYYREQGETGEMLCHEVLENQELRERVDKLELQIIGLKAKLWDLSELAD